MPIADKSKLFLSIIEIHKGIIYKVANTYCKDADDRKDVVQEIILQLWKSFDRYNEQFKHSTWIYRISLNVAISAFRKENTRKKMATSFTETFFTVVDFQDDYQTDQGIVLLHQFISELKELDKALMLLYLDGISYKEMAEIIGITQTNLATKIGRIKLILKQRFSQITI